MALVADYSGSDEDEFSDSEQLATNYNENSNSQDLPKTITPIDSQVSTKQQPSLVEPGRRTISKFDPFFNDSEEEDEEQLNSEKGGLLEQVLPKPKTSSAVGAEGGAGGSSEEVGPIPPKKVYGDEERPPPPKPTSNYIPAKKLLSGRIVIQAPSLKQFDDIEDDEKSPRNVIQPSKKGSGLFALLPAPKGISSSTTEYSFSKPSSSKLPARQNATESQDSDNSRGESESGSSGGRKSGVSTLPHTLLPDSVRLAGERAPPSKLQQIKEKFLKKEANVKIVSRGKKSTAVVQDNDGESEDSDEEGSAGFFSFDSGTKELDEETLERLKLPDIPQQPIGGEEQVEEPLDWSPDQPTPPMQSPQLMEFVGKNKKRKGGEKGKIEMIDVSADDLRPDATEWIKNLTDESAVPARRGKALGGTVKRKHQITYLASEAKAREQELQQMWAAGRQNKRQTRMKYGF